MSIHMYIYIYIRFVHSFPKTKTQIVTTPCGVSPSPLWGYRCSSTLDLFSGILFWSLASLVEGSFWYHVREVYLLCIC